MELSTFHQYLTTVARCFLPSLMNRTAGSFSPEDLALSVQDKPNYLLVLKRAEYDEAKAIA